MSSIDEKYLEIPTIVVNLDTDIQNQFDVASPNDRQKIARKFILDNLRSDFVVKDNQAIMITYKTAKKISHTLFEPKIRIAPYLVEALKIAKFEYIADSDKTRNDGFDKFVYYNVKFDIGGRLFLGLINVGINTKENSYTLYDINPLHEI